MSLYFLLLDNLMPQNYKNITNYCYNKARACESLGFVVNKNNFLSSVSGKRRKNEKGAP